MKNYKLICEKQKDILLFYKENSTLNKGVKIIADIFESELAQLESELDIDLADKCEHEYNYKGANYVKCIKCGNPNPIARFEKQSEPTETFNHKTQHEKLMAIAKGIADLHIGEKPTERKTAEEMLGNVVNMISLKDVLVAVGDKAIITPNEALKAMHEFASQRLPEITDEEIELIYPTDMNVLREIYPAFDGTLYTLRTSNLIKQEGFKKAINEIKSRILK